MDIEEIRAEFLAYEKQVLNDMDIGTQSELIYRHDGSFVNRKLQTRFEVWQAAREHYSKPSEFCASELFCSGCGALGTAMRIKDKAPAPQHPPAVSQSLEDFQAGIHAKISGLCDDWKGDFMRIELSLTQAKQLRELLAPTASGERSTWPVPVAVQYRRTDMPNSLWRLCDPAFALGLVGNVYEFRLLYAAKRVQATLNAKERE